MDECLQMTVSEENVAKSTTGLDVGTIVVDY